MADFEVTITLDPDAFMAAISDWTSALQGETDLATIEAAEYIKEQLQEQLSRFPHSRSEPTPALPYVNPPGLITGAFRDSITINYHRIALASSFREVGTRLQAEVYPDAAQARILELGGFTGTDHETYIPPRPYFFPVITRLVSATGPDGLNGIYYRHWLDSYRVFYTRPPGFRG